jgi:uncharacterized protein YacL
MVLWVIRSLFLLVWAGLGSYLAWRLELERWRYLGLVSLCVLLGLALVAIDVLMPRKKIGVLAAVFFGLLLGTILGQLIWQALSPALWYIEQTFVWAQPRTTFQTVVEPALNFLLTSLLCYLAISFILQTQDDFRFVIPYVEFSKELRSSRPVILDASAATDGRILQLLETRLFDTTVIIPSFVLSDIERTADSADRAKRARGRRALELITQLRRSNKFDLETPDVEPPELQNVMDPHQKLVRWAKRLRAKLVTADYNLAKLAEAAGVDVLNINDVAEALRPVVLPGDQIRVRLIRPGDQPGQGVGYLDDGTMVVIEDGRRHVGDEVEATITSVIQTHAGRMVFGRIELRQPQKA